MARTTAEIKKTMTDAFMADAVIREKYGLSAGDTFAGLASVKIGWARRVSRRALNSWIERRGTGRAQRTEARNLF